MSKVLDCFVGWLISIWLRAAPDSLNTCFSWGSIFTLLLVLYFPLRFSKRVEQDYFQASINITMHSIQCVHTWAFFFSSIPLKEKSGRLSKFLSSGQLHPLRWPHLERSHCLISTVLCWLKRSQKNPFSFKWRRQTPISPKVTLLEDHMRWDRLLKIVFGKIQLVTSGFTIHKVVSRIYCQSDLP